MSRENKKKTQKTEKQIPVMYNKKYIYNVNGLWFQCVNKWKEISRQTAKGELKIDQNMDGNIN